MLPLPIPKLDAATVFDACSSTARSKADRAKLKRLTPAVVDAVVEYEAAAVARSLHTLQRLRHRPGGPPTGVPPEPTAINRTLVNGYVSRMVPEGRSGHTYYQELQASAPDGHCSLCGHGLAETLDHQLPKAVYPLLAVAPSNLAPVCRDCNTNKRDKEPVDAYQQVLNPYFDHEAQQHTWVTACIVGPPIVVTFRAVPPIGMPPVLAARARYHFDQLKLAPLYASQAAGVVRVESRSLKQRSLPPQQVRDHLTQQAALWATENRNGWQSALFTALAGNDWYVTEGHKA
jgi:hypothetical protein